MSQDEDEDEDEDDAHEVVQEVSEKVYNCDICK